MEVKNRSVAIHYYKCHKLDLNHTDHHKMDGGYLYQKEFQYNYNYNTCLDAMLSSLFANLTKPVILLDDCLIDIMLSTLWQ